MRAKRAEEIPTILANGKAYPTPIRIVGGDYSQTRCVGGDGGTTVNLSSLDKILEFGENEVRAQAGVRVGTLARALAERGHELPLTPEMGHMTLGAVAVTTLPQASYETGVAQISSLVKEIKLITPQGKPMTVTERNVDLLRVLCSSFGLLGIVHEVVLRVQPLTPVQIDYQVLTLKEFGARFAGIVKAPGALRLHISPFNDQITVERRTPDETASIEPVRHLADSQVGDAQRAARVRIDGGQRARLSRGRRSRGVGYAAGAARDPRPGGAATWCCTRTNGSGIFRRKRGSRATPTPCGRFRRPTIPSFWVNTSPSANPITSSTIIAATSSTARAACTKTAVHCSASASSGPMFTLEPSSTGDRGWDEFLIDFNDFASALGRSAHLQSVARIEARARRARRSVSAPSCSARCVSARIRSTGCATAISPT